MLHSRPEEASVRLDLDQVPAKYDRFSLAHTHFATLTIIDQIESWGKPGRSQNAASEPGWPCRRHSETGWGMGWGEERITKPLDAAATRGEYGFARLSTATLYGDL
jgi:hypothetical protein